VRYNSGRSAIGARPQAVSPSRIASTNTVSRPSTSNPGYTEPRAAVASWDGNGDVIVWSKHAASVRHEEMLAEVLELPASKVRVIVPGIGGGFGASCASVSSITRRWLARKSRRPVKVITTSEKS